MGEYRKLGPDYSLCDKSPNQNYRAALPIFETSASSTNNETMSRDSGCTESKLTRICDYCDIACNCNGITHVCKLGHRYGPYI